MGAAHQPWADLRLTRQQLMRPTDSDGCSIIPPFLRGKLCSLPPVQGVAPEYLSRSMDPAPGRRLAPGGVDRSGAVPYRHIFLLRLKKCAVCHHLRKSSFFRATCQGGSATLPPWVVGFIDSESAVGLRLQEAGAPLLQTLNYFELI